MPGMLHQVEDRARRAARSATFTMMGIVFGTTGLALLSVALWLMIAVLQGAIVACAAIGALYLILGVCFMALGRHPGAAHPPEPAQPKDPLVQIAEGFATGMRAGRAARDPDR